MQGKLRYRSDAERERAREMGIDDGEKIFRIDEMARGDVMFASTGVTNGDFLKGVRFTGDGARTPFGGDAQPDRDGPLYRDRAPFPAEAQLRMVATGNGERHGVEGVEGDGGGRPGGRVLEGDRRLRRLPGLRARR